METDAARGTVSEKCINIKSEKWSLMQREGWREKLCSAETEMERVGEGGRNREIWSRMQTEREGERNGG